MPKINKIELKAIDDKTKNARNSVGGYPVFSKDQEWPVCKLCDEKMVLFFQMDLAEKFQLPFKPNSHLLLFMCRKDDEPVWGENRKGPLPENYMETEHYRIILNPPDIQEKQDGTETSLVYSELTFEEINETIQTVGPERERFDIGEQLFKVGGLPSWTQDPEEHTCTCGAEMKFICQVPQDFNFSKEEGAESQTSSYSKTHYNIFLGNEAYIFACEKQCNPLATLVVCQSD
jgi:uncharacterized protein YwqG